MSSAPILECERGRPLGTLERMFLGVESYFPVNFCATFTVCGEPPRESIARAAARVSDVFPILNARRTGMGGRPRIVLSPLTNAPVAWEDAGTDWDAVMVRELGTPFHAVGPNYRVCVKRENDGTKFLFTFSHVIADGGSAVLVMRCFLRLLQDEGRSFVEPGAARGLPLPLEEASPPEWRGGVPLGLRLRTGVTLAKRPNFSLKSARNARIGLHRRQLERAATQSLVVRCREHRSTVHGVIMASALRAVARSDARKLACFSPLDLRDMLDSSVRDQVGLYMGGALTWHQLGDVPFWELARDASAQVRETKNESARRALELQIQRLLVRIPPLLSPSIFCSAFVTNMGNVDLSSDGAHVDVDDFWGVLTSAVIGPGIMVTACTHGGALKLAFGHCAPWTDDATAVARVDAAMSMLERAACGDSV